ncbi:MAG: hypothetical protein QOF85_2519 [Solirubrobacterales bacterium]|nr:hypothetical protein [Solirubrobacterales bacterium]
MGPRQIRTILVSCVACGLALLAPAWASAATFKVNTEADTTIVGGCTTEPACSLRDAVAAANTSTDPVDTIEIPAGHYGLSLGQLSVGAGTTTIRGAGARTTTIDGQGASRVFSFSGGEVVLEGVTVTGGLASIAALEEFAGDGGGILVASGSPASLTLNRVTVAGNVANLNGAGISAPPESGMATKVTVNSSTISGNRVSGGAAEGLGGGVYALGDLAIANSTIAGNRVENPGTNQGGGVLAGIDPAETDGTTATLLNATIAGNSVGAGGVGGGFTIDNPTAGVVTTFNVKNTIVTGNLAGTAGADCGTVVTATSSHNISSDASCQFTDAGSRQNTDPRLAALSDNGGPTNTMALLAGSPAIDAGTNEGCPPTDQRGVGRPQGPACDIGAFELAQAPPSIPSANLAIKLKPKPKHPHTGGKLAFVLRLSNSGPNAATGVIVNGAAPASARKIVGKKVNGKRPCRLAKAKPKQRKRKFSCRLGALGAKAAAKLKIVVRSGGKPGKLRAKARVRSGVPDPQAKNNKTKAVVKVKR